MFVFSYFWRNRNFCLYVCKQKITFLQKIRQKKYIIYMGKKWLLTFYALGFASGNNIPKIWSTLYFSRFFRKKPPYLILRSKFLNSEPRFWFSTPKYIKNNMSDPVITSLNTWNLATKLSLKLTVLVVNGLN